MATPLQLGFSEYEQTHARKKTRRQIFLDDMEAAVPWDSFLALIPAGVLQAHGQGWTTSIPVGGEAAPYRLGPG
ncbi:hypothetical protein FPZ61_04515 [Synechococcus sp. BSA11S]|uniref:hypothetical protein n=1 Tax=Synechococcus sp. BSA11S TaxID=2599077 RepID=UPI0016258B8A|nr:hypothetical protein [Synechococcus sp. BSA11S]MBC1263434.1 hypothetical protein [Synechococcus sp. BSA11S]